MGWSQGQSLGKRDDGLTEPVSLLLFGNVVMLQRFLLLFQINVVGNEGTAGIGSTSKTTVITASATVASEKQKLWRKTQERFDKLPDVNDVDDSV